MQGPRPMGGATFFSRVLMICLCLAVIGTVFPTVLALMGYRDPFRGLIRTVTAPFRYVAVAAGDAVDGFVAYFTEYDRLREENERLREQLADYDAAMARAEAVADENAWLKEYFGMLQSNTVHTMESVRVTDCVMTGSSAQLTLSRGSLHGLAAGMPVVILEGVVGYIREVGPNWATVSVLYEPGNGAGAYVLRSGAPGLLEGSLSLFQDGLCRLTLQQADADVQVGDVLYTSGGGSVYPEGLPLGRVVAVAVDDFSKKTVAEVAPAVSAETLPGLTRVMVLTSTTLQIDAESESETEAAP